MEVYAWKVMPEKFWLDPERYKIDLPEAVIKNGIRDGSLHRLLVARAVAMQLDVPERVKKRYNL